MKTPLERILMEANKEEMTSFMAAHPEYFEEAVWLALSDTQPLAWRAAWLLCDCMEGNDTRMRGYLDAIVEAIPEMQDGHQRELLKILLRMEVGEEHEGRLFDVCVSVWEQPAKQPSVRITAFRHILAMAKKYPELANEIRGLTQDWHLESLSPGVRKSISRMLRDPALRRTSR
ncbi:MAG: hypothetical protein JXA28_00875 [Bacteroidetes bacterium]|nr:hypothetical protein [Bacteroidota bacterium]